MWCSPPKLAQQFMRFGTVKTYKFIQATLLCLLVASCSSTKFTAYRGAGLVSGKGGTVRAVNGIDFWENGDPDRNYRILGVVDDSRGEGLLSQMGKDGDIAEVAHLHGGDAVILVDDSREFRGVDLDSGVAHYKRVKKLLVVKYVK